MDAKQFDRDTISRLTEAQLRQSLYSAVTIMRKVAEDIPKKARRDSKSYNKQGHIRCVNYLRGFLNVWEEDNGA